MRPRSYACSTFCTRSSYSARISSFSGGMTTSFFEIVTPAFVRVVEAEILDRVEDDRDRMRAVLVDERRR